MSDIERERLTDAIVKRLPRPETGNRIAYDSDVAGFGCRVTAAGSRAFILNYRTRTGRERRHTIGRYPDWSTTAARAEAKRLRRLIDEGGDPLADIAAERAAPAMADLIERFETEHLVRKRPGTATDYRRMLNNHIRPGAQASEGSGRHLRGRRSPAPENYQSWTSLPRQSRYRRAVEDVRARHPLEHARRQSVRRHRAQRRA